MRDRKVPDDEYNKHLHIYAETPGLLQQGTVPASEKPLNIPAGSRIDVQVEGNNNPYAKIPADDRVEGKLRGKGANPYARIPAGDRFATKALTTNPKAQAPTGGGKDTRGEGSNPYAKIPASVSTGDRGKTKQPSSVPTTSASASSSSSVASQPNRTDLSGTGVVTQRDPIYAELSHKETEDEQVEQTEQGTTGRGSKTVAGSSKSGQRDSGKETRHMGSISSTLPANSSNRRSVIGNKDNASTRTSSKGVKVKTNQESYSLADSTQGAQQSYTSKKNISGKLGKTEGVLEHTRLDASLEIPATPRPKPQRSDPDEDATGGVVLIRKVDRNSGSNQQGLSQEGTEGNDAPGVDVTGVTLSNLTELDSSPPGNGTTASGDVQQGHDQMPVDHDIDAGIKILKKKKRFRRNLIIIIAFLMVLLIVVAAVIISLVIVTKSERIW